MSVIEVQGLTKRYGPVTAIEDLSFQAGEREILGFLGPNGAGKTTTMRILTGFIPASEGNVRLSGFDIREHPWEVKKRIGYLPEIPPLYADMSVDVYLRFVAEIRGTEKARARRRLGEVKELCGLQTVGRTLIRRLSKGYRQRVGMAQAIIHEPEILILDEPTIGLDPKQIIEVRHLIKSLGERHTVLLSTHILPEVSMTCQRVIILNKGKLVAVDTPEGLLRRLQGGERIFIRFRVDRQGPSDGFDPAEVARVPGVRRIVREVLGDSSLVSLELEVEDDQEVRGRLAEYLVGRGWKLQEMRSVNPTLEEIFIRLVTEEPVA
ncbi:MAG: ATP-binding cassette domain-containing protein [Acidobacteria bacterium]|nr:ATP-binding cassette domain-containing protein [Acidobacteriota bacterium]